MTDLELVELAARRTKAWLAQHDMEAFNAPNVIEAFDHFASELLRAFKDHYPR